jgi:hypothetical protein
MNGLKLRRLPETLSHLEKMGSFPAYINTDQLAKPAVDDLSALSR